MALTLRTASPADVESIVQVFLACWGENYSHVLPTHVLQSMTESRAHTLWARALSSQDGGEEVTVATDALTGVIHGVLRHGLDRPGHGIIWSLYVSPSAQGRGIGSRLLRWAESALTEAGAVAANLWVFADNAPSIAFYAHHGWAPVSITPVQSREFGEPTYQLRKSFGDIRSEVTATSEPRATAGRPSPQENATAGAESP